jgi:NDP-sugar pyrophosphorylase family protein
VIGAGVKIKSSILADNCKIGDDVILTGVVVGDHVTVIEGVKLKKGSRVMPGKTIKNDDIPVKKI